MIPVSYTHLDVYKRQLIRNREKAEAIYGDLLERKDLLLILGDVTEKLFMSQKVDYIFHCASRCV